MKQQKEFFNAVFSYIVDTFQIKARKLIDKAVNYRGDICKMTEQSVSKWKNNNPPKEDIFEDFCEIVETVLQERIPYASKTRELFLDDMKAIFSAYNLFKVYQEIASQGLEYQELVMCFLRSSYEAKHQKMPDELFKVEKPVSEIKKLVVFDVDGTLIKGIKYSWQLLYQAVEISVESCEAKKKEFVNGEISYPEWVAFDLKKLKAAGLTRIIAEKATKEKCKLTVNFKKAIDRLKNNGCALGIISGGADVVLNAMIPNVQELFDGNVFINRMIFDPDGALKDIEATPYDWDDEGRVRGVQGKNEGLRKMAAKYELGLNDCVFVGDDDNDFKAMQLAGTKIFYHSGNPNDITCGNGARRIPEGVKFVMKDDLMLVVDIILGTAS